MTLRHFVASVLAVILGVVVAVFIYSQTVGSGVTHSDMVARLISLERAVVYNGCIIMADGDPQAMADCQLPDPID